MFLVHEQRKDGDKCMKKEIVECPKCKGCGQIEKVIRSKMVFSDDPTKKWCAKCKTFLEKDKFFRKTGYCKKCQTIKNRERINDLKYPIKCVVCSKSFNSYRKGAKVCSQRCRCVRSNQHRSLASYRSLPNELLESGRNDEQIPWDYYERYTK